MNATSGPTSGKQFATYDLDTQSWKMWPAIGLWGSIEYSETWPKTGYMRDGQAFELPTSAPLTIENGSSSSSHLPTPRAMESDQTMGSPGASRHAAAGNGGLSEVLGVMFLPTPKANDFRDNNSPAEAAHRDPALPAVSVYFPTPNASDSTGGGSDPARRKQGGHTVQLIDLVLSIGDDTPPLFGDGNE